jgi:hypothetical protein
MECFDRNRTAFQVSDRAGKAFRGSVVPQPITGEEPARSERCRFELSAPADDFQQEATAFRCREGQKQSSTLGQPIQPKSRRMRRPGEDNDYVDVTGIVQCAVSGHDFDLRPGRKVRLCARSQYAVVFNSRYSSRRTDEFGEDRAVIAGASPHLQHARPWLQIKGIEKSSPEAGLSIVEIAGSV